MSERQSAPPNRQGVPNVEFRKNEFDVAIWNKGYNVTLETAVRCPCTSESGNLLDCQNCRGSGWIFINPIATRALITSVNYETKYKDWTFEKLGTVAVTVRDSDRISYYDSVEFKDDYSIISEVFKFRYDEDTDKNFVFTSYKPITILEAFIFEDSTSKLIKLEVGTDIEVSATNPYVVIINKDVSGISNFNRKISLRYKHNIRYNVIDLPHDLRRSYIVNSDGKDEKINLPVNAIARRAHNIEAFAKIANFDGSGVLDNTYL